MKSQTYWEYRYVYLKTRTDSVDSIEQMLNTMGNEGWELVSVIEAGEGIDAMIHGYIFKRPKL